jgi:hypothetical protein
VHQDGERLAITQTGLLDQGSIHLYPSGRRGRNGCDYPL